jgi:bifunctional DNA-binding transcriptional regulator/antitoxin component of YhaV-PrlF toxin-antitoxin module
MALSCSPFLFLKRKQVRPNVTQKKWRKEEPMLVKVERNQKVVLPESICRKLGISTGDRLKASVKEGRIVLQCVDHQEGDTDGCSNNGRGRILMFGTASEAFYEDDFD